MKCYQTKFQLKHYNWSLLNFLRNERSFKFPLIELRNLKLSFVHVRSYNDLLGGVVKLLTSSDPPPPPSYKTTNKPYGVIYLILNRFQMYGERSTYKTWN